TASQQSVRNRAQLGLARVYEMHNEPEKAKKAYAAVRGIFETVAQQRLEVLESEPNQKAMDWLATADLPEPASLSGGLPGVRPDFAADLPETDAQQQPAITKGSIEELLGKLGEADEDEKRYDETEEGESSEGEPETSEEDASEEVPSEEETAAETEEAE
ncbi:MAG: hypothetical protein RID07_17255, partial [Lacipirellulaceae bacterium]